MILKHKYSFKTNESPANTEDVLNLILNQQHLNQNLLASVSKSVYNIVMSRANMFINIKILTLNNELNLLKELCLCIPAYNATTIYYNNTEWYLQLD